MLLSWVIFPVVTALVCLGLGLLLDAAAGRTLRPVLVLPVGAAVLVCLTQLTTISSATAPATVPVVVATAVAGGLLGWRRLPALGSTWPALLAALGVFLVSGAAVIATGTPTFAGYTVLGDTAAHLIGADELLRHGRDADAILPSNAASTFRAYYDDNAYPSGGAATLGTLSRVVGQDGAWVFQPYLSALLALLALALVGLVEPLVAGRWRSALVGFLAAQPALLVAFAMQGGMKEIALSLMLAALAAVTADAADVDAGWREALAVAVTAGGAVGVMGPSAAVWVLPIVLGGLVIALRQGRSPRSLVVPGVVVAGVGAVCVAQTLVLLGTAASAATSVASAAEVGNLLRPLSLLQGMGVWLTGDFRVAPTGVAMALTRVCEIVVLAAAVLGVRWVASKRAWMPLVYGGTLLVGAIFVIVRGSLWADSKALAIVSPAVLVLAMVGLVSQLDRHRVPAGAAMLVVALGVLASNALIYRSASVAPYHRLKELSAINDRLAGDGPVLDAEFDEFAPYFLRDAGADPAPLLIASPGDVGGPKRGAAADLDGMTVADIDRYPSLITRQGPIGSRPSSAYRRAFETEHYVVWRRREGRERVVARAAIGGPRAPRATPSCATIAGIARQARDAGGRLVFALGPVATTVNPARASMPDGWRVDPEDSEVTLPSGGGAATARVTVPATGRYAVWLEASIGRNTEVRVDGRRVGAMRNRLSGRRTAERYGTIELTAGPHTVTVDRVAPGLAPGAGGLFRPLGPVYFVPEGHTRVASIPASGWRRLCDRPLDWVEAVA